MSRSPLQVTPIATYTGRLVTCPSRTLTMIASMNTTGYTLSSGRSRHSVISSITLSVILDIVSLLTVAPYTSAKCAAIYPVVNPRAESDRTI
jgi:hypothetical protein